MGKDADGCAGSLTPAKCKTSTNEVVGGNCVAKCKTYEAFGTFTGKCHSGCVSNVGTGTVNGGALNTGVGGCYSNEGMEAQLCAKGYHVQVLPSVCAAMMTTRRPAWLLGPLPWRLS